MKTLLRFKWAILLLGAGGGLLAWTLAGFFGVLFAEPDATFTAPGETGTLRVVQPGDFIVWYESATMVGGRLQEFPPRRRRARSTASGRCPRGPTCPSSPPATRPGRSTNSAASSVARFTVAAPGDYNVCVGGLSEARVFSVTRDWFARTFLRFFAGMAASVVLLLAGLGAGIYVLVRVIAERKAARAMA